MLRNFFVALISNPERRLRGVITLEQRPSAANHPVHNCKIPYMVGKGDQPMKETNTTETPKRNYSLRNCILFGFHVVVLLVSLWVHPLSLTHADRALP